MAGAFDQQIRFGGDDAIGAVYQRDIAEPVANGFCAMWSGYSGDIVEIFIIRQHLSDAQPDPAEADLGDF